MAKKKIVLGKEVPGPGGFPAVKFTDFYKNPCYMQCSSIILSDDGLGSPGTSAIWLGVANDTSAASMHLDRRQVTGLINHLASWLKTGRFE